MTLFKTQTQCMNGHFRWFLRADDMEWGEVLRHHFASIILERYHVIRTQTPIWHVTVRETNATGDCSELAHCAASVGNTTPQWQPSTSALWAALHPGCKPSAPTLAHPQPNPPPSIPPPSSSMREHILSPCYHFFCIVDLLVVDSHSCCCHSCIFFPHFALHLWHLSLLVPFHKLVQQNWPW